FQAKVKYLSGGEGFGLAVRASEDGRTLYLLQFLSGDFWQLVRYDGVVLESGPWVRLASGSYKIVPGTWYTVRVDVQGARITGYVNEAQVITAEDARYLEGGVGFRVHTSRVFFDNVEVKPLSNP
ncbi:MAG: family 16 glycoside hydrolase, partial [Anaerolineae bacterium]